MKKIKTLCAAVDFSEASKAALQEAARIAMWEKGELHVINVMALEEAVATMEKLTFGKEILDPAVQQLKEFADHADFLCPNTTHRVYVGRPYQSILKLMEEEKADLLVIGSHGEGGGHGYVGGVASRCIRNSPVPVLVVRKQHQEPFKVVLACTDFSETAQEALEYGAEIADKEGADFHIINVQTDPWAIYTFPITGSTERQIEGYLETARGAAERELEKLESRMKEFHPGLNIITSVLPGVSVNQGIMDYVAAKHVDLAVVGTRGRSKLAKFFIGTTTERLIHKCPCSVLTVS